MNKIQLPKDTIICGILYRVVEKDNMIIFSEASGFYGCCNRMVFTREYKGCWRIQLFLTFDNMMASHICEAYNLVCQWRGKNFK